MPIPIRARRSKPRLRSLLGALTLLVLPEFPAPALAYSPILIRPYFMPGKGAASVHSNYETRFQSPRESAFRQDVSYGLSKAFALNLRSLLWRSNTVALHEFSVGASRRFDNTDSLKTKDSLILNAEARIAPSVASFSGGMAYLYERLSNTRHVYVGAVSLEPDSPTGNAGVEPWVHGAYGFRFLHYPEIETDAMFYLETGGKVASPELFFLAPELLLQPGRRVVLKTGLRFILSATPPERKDTQFIFQLEVRI